MSFDLFSFYPFIDEGAFSNLQVMFSCFLFFSLVTSLVMFTLPTKSARLLSFKIKLTSILLSLFTSKVAQLSLVGLFVILAYSNILGNVPGNYTPTQYYSVVMSLSLRF